MVQFYRSFIKKNSFYHGTNHKVGEENITFYLYHKVSKNLGLDQVKIHGTNSNTSKWQLEFHVHTYASLLAVGAMLAQNPIGKYDQLIVYASRLLNKAK